MPVEYSIGQSEHYEGNDWWQWAVFIQASDEALDRIDFVEWRLHPTFPNPVRKSSDRASRFRLETGGWGVFPIVARVQLKAGTEIRLSHHLALHYPDGTQTSA